MAQTFAKPDDPAEGIKHAKASLVGGGNQQAAVIGAEIKRRIGRARGFRPRKRWGRAGFARQGRGDFGRGSFGFRTLWAVLPMIRLSGPEGKQF